MASNHNWEVTEARIQRWSYHRRLGQQKPSKKRFSIVADWSSESYQVKGRSFLTPMEIGKLGAYPSDPFVLLVPTSSSQNDSIFPSTGSGDCYWLNQGRCFAIASSTINNWSTGGDFQRPVHHGHFSRQKRPEARFSSNKRGAAIPKIGPVNGSRWRVLLPSCRAKYNRSSGGDIQRSIGRGPLGFGTVKQ